MRVGNNLTGKLRVAALITLGGLSLSACATRSYVDEQIAGVNTRISAVEARANDAAQRADAAGAAAQAASTAVANTNARIDQLTTRVDTIEQQRIVTTRQPRG